MAVRLRIKARVLLRLQLPIGDPRVKGMNDTQWLFALESVNYEDHLKEKEKTEMFEAVRQQVSYMLGLQVVPVEDPSTGLLRFPKLEEATPLSLLLGGEALLTHVKAKYEEYAVQEQVRQEMAQATSAGSLGSEFPQVDGVTIAPTLDPKEEWTPEELEKFMADEGDISFDSDLNDSLKALSWARGTDKIALETLVLNQEDDDNLLDRLDGPVRVRTLGETRRDMIRSGNAGHSCESKDFPQNADKDSGEELVVTTEV